MTNLDLTSKKCHFLQYICGVKVYMIWDPLACRYGISRDIFLMKKKVLRFLILTLKRLHSRMFDHYKINDVTQGVVLIQSEQVSLE